MLMSKKQKWYIRENNPNDTYTMQNAGTFIQFTVSMGALSESHFFSSPEIFWLNCVLHLSVHRYVVNFSHFQLPLQNDCIPSHQTYHKCSSRGPEEGLYLFEVLRIPSSLSWLLIGRHIFHFFSRFSRFDKCSSRGPKEVFFSGLKNPTWPVRPLIALDILFLNYFIWSHQTCHKPSFRGSEEVLLFVGVMQNPR